MREDFKKYNTISKFLIKIGTALLIGLIIFAISVRLYITIADADCSVQLFYEDLLECIKESFGSIYLCAIFLEMLHIKIY